MCSFQDLNKKLEIAETPDYQETKIKPGTSGSMSGDRPPKRSGRRSGRRSSKLDGKAKLERSRQSARECRARKKLRYQYLEDLVLNREKAVFALRDELELYKQWCILLDKEKIPVELLKLLEANDAVKQDSSSEDNDEETADADVIDLTADVEASPSDNSDGSVDVNSIARLTLQPRKFRTPGGGNLGTVIDHPFSVQLKSKYSDGATGTLSDQLTSGATGSSSDMHRTSLFSVPSGNSRHDVKANKETGKGKAPSQFGRRLFGSKQALDSTDLQSDVEIVWPDEETQQKAVVQNMSHNLPTILEDIES